MRRQIQKNILAALNQRLQGHPRRVLGSDLKVKAMNRIRYPDSLVTCTKSPGTDRLVPGVVIVFASTLGRLQENEDHAAGGSAHYVRRPTLIDA